MRILKTVFVMALLLQSVSGYSWVDSYVRECKSNFSTGRYSGYEPNVGKWGMNGNSIDIGDSDNTLNSFCPKDYGFYLKFLDYIPNHMVPWGDANCRKDMSLFAFNWGKKFKGEWLDIAKRMLLCSKIKALQELKRKVKIVNVSDEKKVKLYEEIDMLEDCLRDARKRSEITSCHHRHKTAFYKILQ